MHVTIAVPLGNPEPHRDAAWEHAQAWWARETPDWPIVTGTHRGEKYRKGVAVARALAQVETDHVLIVDADCLIPNLPQTALELEASDSAWCMPHLRIYRLTPEATRLVHMGVDPFTLIGDRGLLLERYKHVIGAGAVLMPTEDARRVPFDPRFEGWGGADWSWGWALQTLLGAPLRPSSPMVHLWHPPQPRPSRSIGSPENEALRARYKAAFGDLTAMRILIDEALEALPSLAVEPRELEGRWSRR